MKDKTLIIIFLSFFIVIKGQVPTYVPTDGLLAWYNFDGNANDNSGNNIHGTIFGASSTSDRFGSTNGAYYFDGIDDRINFGNVFPTVGSPNQPSTISFWFKTSNGFVGTTHGTMVSDYQRQGATLEFSFWVEFLIDTEPDRVRWWQRGNGQEPIIASNINYIDNTWHHVVLVADGIGTKSMYIDGSFISSTSYDASVNYADQTPTNEPDWNLGCQHWNDGTGSTDYIHFYEGNLDDLGIWNRTLSQSEISEIFNGTVTNHVGINVNDPQRSLHIKDVLRLEPRSGPPDNPSRGDIYFDDSLNKLRVYDGTTWQNCW